MQTGDAELEMRGRCSAGQKVGDHWMWRENKLGKRVMCELLCLPSLKK